MRKVGFFRSIQIKFIIIYILLLLIAIQVIGSYFATKLEQGLTESFLETVDERVKLLSYNLEQAFNKERTDDDQEPSLQEEVQAIVEGGDTNDITRLQVVNLQGRVLGTNDSLNYDIIGKKTTEDIIQKALLLGISPDRMMQDPKANERV